MRIEIHFSLATPLNVPPVFQHISQGKRSVQLSINVSNQNLNRLIYVSTTL